MEIRDISMKKTLILHLVLLGNLFSNAFLNAQEAVSLLLLNENSILQHKESVKGELKRNFYIKIGLCTTCAALTTYGLYYLCSQPSYTFPLASYLKDDSVNVDLSQPNEVVFKQMLIEQKRALNEVYKDTLHERQLRLALQKKLEEAGISFTAPTLFSQIKDQVSFIFKSSLVMTVASILAGTARPFTKYLKILDKGMDKLIDKVFYSPDLNWYLESHTTIFDLFVQAKEHAKALSSTTELPEDFNYHYIGFIDTCNLIMVQLESTLGFMAHKAELIEKDSEINAKRARDLSDRIFNHVNTTISDLQIFLAKLPLEHANGKLLKENLSNLKFFVQESFNKFVRIEFICN